MTPVPDGCARNCQLISGDPDRLTTSWRERAPGGWCAMARRKKRKKVFDRVADRRKSIWRVVRFFGADETDSYDDFLLWVVRSMPDYDFPDPVWSLRLDAKRYGREITEEHAERIVEEAGQYRLWNDDVVAAGSKLTYAIHRLDRR
jgi:hypothetical protein